MLCSGIKREQSCSRGLLLVFVFLATFSFLVHLHKNPSEYLSQKKKRLTAMFGPLFPASRGSKRKGRFFWCCDSLGALSHISMYGPLFRTGLEEWSWEIPETDSALPL